MSKLTSVQLQEAANKIGDLIINVEDMEGELAKAKERIEELEDQVAELQSIIDNATRR